MIRIATRSDLPTVVSLIVDFLTDATAYGKHTDAIDVEHIKKMSHSIISVGRVWLFEINNVAVGLLAAVLEQNIWIPSKHSYREIVWYVKPEFRRNPSAAKLFLEFCREGERLLEQGKIEGFFTTRMATTSEYDLVKRGFREVERLFLRD